MRSSGSGNALRSGASLLPALLRQLVPCEQLGAGSHLLAALESRQQHPAGWRGAAGHHHTLAGRTSSSNGGAQPAWHSSHHQPSSWPPLGLSNSRSSTRSLSTGAEQAAVVEADASAAAAAALPTFDELLESERQLLKGKARRAAPAASGHLSSMLKRFQAHSSVRDRALSVYVRADLYPRAAAAFRKFVMRAATPELAEALQRHERWAGGGGVN
jgi:hypothetical protein